MLENIVIFGSKQEASALVSAISNEAEPNTFEWEGEALEFRAVRGLLLSSSGCSGAGCLDAVLALRGLRALTLSFNGIAALQSLSALEQLQVLDLSHNRLGDLEAVRDLRSLHTLRCNNNQIESVEPLRSVITIRELWISNNNIPWESLINLQPNTNLKIIVMYSNPLETKPKIEEFLKAICPSLEQINGVQCGALDRGGSGDFLATADGRVMATQARAQLTPLQREDIAARTVRRRASSKSLLRSGSLRGALAASRAEEDLSAPPASAGAEGPLGAGADGRSSPSRSEPGVRVYKAQRNKKPSAIGRLGRGCGRRGAGRGADRDRGAGGGRVLRNGPLRERRLGAGGRLPVPERDGLLQVEPRGHRGLLLRGGRAAVQLPPERCAGGRGGARRQRVRDGRAREQRAHAQEQGGGAHIQHCGGHRVHSGAPRQQ